MAAQHDMVTPTIQRPPLGASAQSPEAMPAHGRRAAHHRRRACADFDFALSALALMSLTGRACNHKVVQTFKHVFNLVIRRHACSHTITGASPSCASSTHT